MRKFTAAVVISALASWARRGRAVKVRTAATVATVRFKRRGRRIKGLGGAGGSEAGRFRGAEAERIYRRRVDGERGEDKVRSYPKTIVIQSEAKNL
jgi:hypothetical protein